MTVFFCITLYKLAEFLNCLADYAVQSVTLLWLAYCIGVVEQCCQMVQYN